MIRSTHHFYWVQFAMELWLIPTILVRLVVLFWVIVRITSIVPVQVCPSFSDTSINLILFLLMDPDLDFEEEAIAHYRYLIGPHFSRVQNFWVSKYKYIDISRTTRSIHLKICAMWSPYQALSFQMVESPKNCSVFLGGGFGCPQL